MSLWSFFVRPVMKGKEVMKNTISTTLKAGVAALVLVAASGCVSQKSVDEIKATADKAEQDAAAAKAAADAATAAASVARLAHAADAAFHRTDNAADADLPDDAIKWSLEATKYAESAVAAAEAAATALRAYEAMTKSQN